MLCTNEINEFIRYAYKVNCEYERSVFLEENDNDERLNLLIQRYGVVKALYMNNDKHLTSLINKKCDYNKLKDLMTDFCIETNDSSIRMYNDCGISYKEAVDLYGYKEKYFLSNEDPIEFVNKINHFVLDELKNEEKHVKESFLYLYLSYEFKERILEQDNIEKLYDDLNYGLITINNQRNIMIKHNRICQFPRIYDSLLNKTIFIQIEIPLLNLFNELFNKKIVGKLSLRGKNHMVFFGRNEREILQESLYIGTPFSYDIDKLPRVSEISDYNYRNKLIIVHKDNNLFFEEICNTNINNKKFVETQIIHFEFDINKGIITHLDHEYVYYTNGEFIKKEHILDKKGTYRKKYKTFKLDECSIPINYMCDSYMRIESKIKNVKVPFLYFVLNECFEHKDLLYEYFSSTISN